MMAIPIIVYWAIALWGLFSRKPVLLYLLVLSLPFGSFAVLPPQVTAGLTFLPATMTGMLICVRQFLLHRSGLHTLVTAVSRFDRGALLFLYWGVALVVTICAPRIFEGVIRVMPVRAVRGSGIFLLSDWLRPTTQNVSQMAYLTISVFLTFALFHLLRQPNRLETLGKAFVLGGCLTVFTGFLDLAAHALPIGPLLAPFRTATYSLLTDVTLADGTKRVVGLMPEASAYGSISLSFLSLLWFLRHAYAPKQRRRLMLLCLALLLCAILSTSSAAYVGIAVLGGVAALEWAWRAGHLERFRAARRGVSGELVGAIAGVAILGGVLLTVPTLLDPVVDRVQTMVFDKVDSDSYEERSSWTRISLEAGISSYMMGVGIGSTRSSNSAVAVFASTGLVGFLLYYAFFIQTLRHISSRASHYGYALARATRWSIAPSFILGLLAGTSADFGTGGAIRYALLLAASAPAITAASAGRRARPDRANASQPFLGRT